MLRSSPIAAQVPTGPSSGLWPVGRINKVGGWPWPGTQGNTPPRWRARKGVFHRCCPYGGQSTLRTPYWILCLQVRPPDRGWPEGRSGAQGSIYRLRATVVGPNGVRAHPTLCVSIPVGRGSLATRFFQGGPSLRKRRCVSCPNVGRRPTTKGQCLPFGQPVRAVGGPKGWGPEGTTPRSSLMGLKICRAHAMCKQHRCHKLMPWPGLWRSHRAALTVYSAE